MGTNYVSLHCVILTIVLLLHTSSFLGPNILLSLYCLFLDTSIFVRFQDLTAASMRPVVLCGLVEVHRRFRGACCLRHQTDRSDDGGHSSFFLLLAVQFSNIHWVLSSSIYTY
jgi:hypothetical protein